MPDSRDQLRWNVGGAAYVVLDARDSVQFEMYGVRHPIADLVIWTEAVRAAFSAQGGHKPAWQGHALAAEVRDRAALGRYEAIRQHIADAANRQLRDDAAAGVYPSRGEAIAADAMTGISPIVLEAVTSAAGSILRQLAADQDWREFLGILIRASEQAQVSEMRALTETIAALPRHGEGHGYDGGPYEMTADDARNTLASLVSVARGVLGQPGIVTAPMENNSDDGR